MAAVAAVAQDEVSRPNSFTRERAKEKGSVNKFVHNFLLRSFSFVPFLPTPICNFLNKTLANL